MSIRKPREGARGRRAGARTGRRPTRIPRRRARARRSRGLPTSRAAENKGPRNEVIFAGEPNLCVGSTKQSSEHDSFTNVQLETAAQWFRRGLSTSRGAENKSPWNGANFAGATALCVGSMERPSKRRISTKKTTKTTVRIRCLRNGPTGNSFPKFSETRASWRVCPGIGIPARAG